MESNEKTLQQFDHPNREIADLGPWFHNLHLLDGRQTAPNHPLGDFPRYKWLKLAPHLPADLTGWRALDVGCNAGFYAFELARRGAQVLAIDVDEHYLAQGQWAVSQLNLEDRVEFKQMQVYDLVDLDDAFDLVLFMGVFYHLRYPLLSLDILSEKVRRLLVFQTLTMPSEGISELVEDLTIDERDKLCEPGWPKLAFIEHRFAGDPTNWWAPNPAAVEAMLRSSGFKPIVRPGHEIYVCVPDESAIEVRAARSEELAAAMRRRSN